MTRPRRPAWLIALAIVLAVFVGYLIVGDFFWRNSHLVSDSEDAVVQPAETPPPGGVEPVAVPAPDASANRGQSAVRGDGTPLNGSTAAPGAGPSAP